MILSRAQLKLETLRRIGVIPGKPEPQAVKEEKAEKPADTPKAKRKRKVE